MQASTNCYPRFITKYTYYRPPTAHTLGAMAAKVPPDLVFTIKATKEMTHERDDNEQIVDDYIAALASLLDQNRATWCILCQQSLPGTGNRHDAQAARAT
jgi:uncharacterized protein YecE (DUF72 family)